MSNAPMSKAPLPTKEFKGWHMLAILILFFGTIITVNLTMAYFARTSWTGLVVKNSYVASQEFNETTDQKRAELAMGWSSSLAYENGALDLTLTDKDKAGINNAIVTATVGRPSYEADDRIVQFTQTKPGQFTASTQLGSGIWDADMTVIGENGESWTRKLRILVK